jgi:hypothetical protein
MQIERRSGDREEVASAVEWRAERGADDAAAEQLLPISLLSRRRGSL